MPWVSVKDRLPAQGGRYPVLVDGIDIDWMGAQFFPRVLPRYPEPYWQGSAFEDWTLMITHWYDGLEPFPEGTI